MLCVEDKVGVPEDRDPNSGLLVSRKVSVEKFIGEKLVIFIPFVVNKVISIVVLFFSVKVKTRLNESIVIFVEIRWNKINLAYVYYKFNIILNYIDIIYL